jgi:tRNA threonylcarbamoyladenosine modification (KEOPS) complex Cgi121 subunit
MLYEIEEHDISVEITGFEDICFSKMDAFLKATRENQQSVAIQFFDADLIASSEHLYFAVLNASHAFRCKTNISKSVGMETMLYAAAQRQIKKAIVRIGIKPDTKSIAVVIVGSKTTHIQEKLQTIVEYVGHDPDDSVLELTKTKIGRIKKIFQISQAAIDTQNSDSEKAIVDLLIEQMAVLATQI